MKQKADRNARCRCRSALRAHHATPRGASIRIGGAGQDRRRVAGHRTALREPRPPRAPADRAFQDAARGGGDGGRELTGMACLLKDGLVSYLREFAKITPPVPKQVVKFCGIAYSTRIETAAFSYETFGNKLLECFLQPVRSLSLSKRLAELPILKGIDGYIMPGSITLVLGQPGSGKSTLLKILAGRADPGNNSGLTGTVFYNDKPASEVQKSRLIAYVCGQLNKHIPFLSVRETLEFARDCTQGLRPENFTPQMRKFFAYALVEGQDPFLEYVMQILDLKKIENCLVSGISDGDRHKLTTAELELGTYSVMVYDQPLTGSDRVMTYDLVNTIRSVCRIQQSSAVMALNHLSQEAFDLFDRIILLGEGHVLYQGPRQDAVTYFAQLGYMKPPHVESWEFLQDIAAENGMQYLLPRSTPRDLEELVECYYSSDHYLDIIRIIGMGNEFSTYWVESEPGIGLSLTKTSMWNSNATSDEHQAIKVVVSKLLNKSASGVESTGNIQVGDVRNENEPQWEKLKRPYVQPWRASTRTLIQRQFRILKQLHVLSMLRLIQVCILGIFAGTLFYKLGGHYNLQNMNSVRTLGFVATMSILLINMPQLPLYMLQRPIFYKHRDQRFFRISSYVVAHCVTNLPQAFVEAFLYSVCVYFLAGLTRKNNGAVFFDYLILMFLVAYFGSSIFFFLSAVASIPEVANALAGLIVSIFLLFSGFVIYPSNIPHYWKWLMHINPIRWANLSFCDQQFLGGYKDPCNKYVNHLNFCTGNTTMASGKAYMLYAQLLTSVLGKPWVSYMILIGWTLFAQFMAFVSLHKIVFSQMSQSVPQMNERKFSKNILYHLESHSSSLDGGVEGSFGSGRYKPLEIPNLESRSTKGIYDDDSGSVRSWMEEYIAETESEQLTIPVTPITLTFLDISFSGFSRDRCGTVTKEYAFDFENVTGHAAPGTMLALVGGGNESVATLLKCLAGRTPPYGNFTGDLRVSSTESAADFSKYMGYVEQLDAHQPFLTVRESLQFSASLRLANGVIAKKLTIAVELATNPSILFLEDPLSGLDSSGTSGILSILSQLPTSGQTVIATISHPTLASSLLWPCRTQDCHEILGYFTMTPRVPQYIETQNPISYIMDITGHGIPRTRIAATYLAKEFQNSHLCEMVRKAVKTTVRSNKLRKQKDRNMITDNYKYPGSPIRQLGMILLRTQRFLWRNVNYTYSRFTGCVMIGLLMDSLYFKIKYDDTYGIGTDRLAYFREMRSKMYLPIFYPLSWVISEIPYFLIATLAFVGIGNGMAGIATQTAANFLTCWSILFVFTLYMTYFGMMVTLLAPNPILAAFLVSIITSMWVSASVVVVLFSDIRFYKWIYWTNPFQHAISALIDYDKLLLRHIPMISSIRSLSQERLNSDVITLAGMCTTFVLLAFLFFTTLKHNSPHAH
ncbi:hypothetical protein EJB05_24234, partial [Eragrostis curvula]